MHWLLTFTLILTKPLTEPVDGSTGDLVRYVPFGVSASEESCSEAADALGDQMKAAGGDSIIVTHNCTEIPVAVSEAISEAQGWGTPEEGGWFGGEDTTPGRNPD